VVGLQHRGQRGLKATEAGIFRKDAGRGRPCVRPATAKAHQPNEFIWHSQIDACEVFMRRMVEWACGMMGPRTSRSALASYSSPPIGGERNDHERTWKVRARYFNPRQSRGYGRSGSGLEISSRDVWEIRYCGWKR